MESNKLKKKNNKNLIKPISDKNSDKNLIKI
jgi:hypothetical protein